MTNCKTCGKQFRDIFNLSKHMSRIKPCTINLIKSKIISEGKNVQLESKNVQLEGKNVQLEGKNVQLESKNVQLESKKSEKSSLLNPKKCNFCLNIFSSNRYLKIHEYACKQRDDPIRLLEIDQDTCPILPDSKTECRFCEKNLCKTSYLNRHILICKKREEYHQTLLKKKEKSIQIITNNCNNSNNTTNIGTQNNNINNTNVIINILGQENMDHVKIEGIIQLLRDIRKEFGDNQVTLMAGNLIGSFDDYIRETPENQNISIPEPKSLYGNVKTDRGWKKISADRCLNTAFKNSAKELYTHKEEIDECNEKVFKNATNKQIFNEVKQFGISGLSGNSDDLRQIKTSFKVNKLEKKEIDF